MKCLVKFEWIVELPEEAAGAMDSIHFAKEQIKERFAKDATFTADCGFSDIKLTPKEASLPLGPTGMPMSVPDVGIPDDDSTNVFGGEICCLMCRPGNEEDERASFCDIPFASDSKVDPVVMATQWALQTVEGFIREGRSDFKSLDGKRRADKAFSAGWILRRNGVHVGDCIEEEKAIGFVKG